MIPDFVQTFCTANKLINPTCIDGKWYGLNTEQTWDEIPQGSANQRRISNVLVGIQSCWGDQESCIANFFFPKPGDTSVVIYARVYFEHGKGEVEKPSHLSIAEEDYLTKFVAANEAKLFAFALELCT